MEFEDAKVLVDSFLLNSSNDDYDKIMKLVTSYKTKKETVDKLYVYLNSLENLDNNSNALHLLGMLDDIGCHRSLDVEKSYYFLRKAEKLNNIYTNYEKGQKIYNRDIIYDPQSKIHNIIDAKMYYELAANGGMVKAQIMLGNIYAMEKNIKEASKWYTMALASKDPNAPRLLGDLYADRDIMKSVEYYKLAIEQNNVEAKQAFEKILKENENYAIINKLQKENDALKIQIEELELMPEGPKYKEAKDHFNKLAKSSE
jgi:TPR repeat protein